MGRGELEKIAESDINMYFQLVLEMFDYLDELIAFQDAGEITKIIKSEERF